MVTDIGELRKSRDLIIQEFEYLIRPLALRLAQKGHDLDDLLSLGNEVLVNAASRLVNEVFDPKRSYNTIRNYCSRSLYLKMLKRVMDEKKKRRIVKTNLSDDDNVAIICDPSSRLPQQENRALLMTCIKELPEKYRTAIELHYGFNGEDRPLTHREAADKQDIPYDTQLTHELRGLKLLRENPKIIALA
ncbi:MAG: sigma-70 family RNA polymerase sigma factor [Nanoarchaeota archaeon]